MQILQRIYVAFGLLFLGALFLNYSSDPPEGRTGAPGESTCATCHSGNSNNYTGDVTISGLPAFLEVNTTYTVVVCVNNTSGDAFQAGYQFTALDADGMSVGTYSNFEPESVLGTRTLMGDAREYIDHDFAKSFVMGSACWSFDWTSPATSMAVSFYAAGNMVDGFGNTGGDFVVTTEQVNIPLPVSLTRFEAFEKGNMTVLEWETASERETTHFEIERSTDGLNFETIEKIQALDNGDIINQYSYEDKSAFLYKTVYYRLKMVDLDGSFAYSKVEVVEFKLEYNGLVLDNVYPNPIGKNETLNLNLFSNLEKQVTIQIIDVTGQLKYTQAADITAGNNNIALPIVELSKGLYTILLVDKLQNQFIQHKVLVTE